MTTLALDDDDGGGANRGGGNAGNGGRVRRYSGGDLAPLHPRPPPSHDAALRRHASQATMWYTTVPQPVSLSEKPLGSRHAPTRRSLRRSRMLGLQHQQQQQVARPTLYQPVERRRKSFNLRVIFPFLPEPPGSPTLADLGLCLALGLAQLTLGATLLATSAAAVAADAAWASALAPNLCGLLVCLSGWSGVPLAACHRLVFKRSGQALTIRTSYVILILILSAASFICCLVAFGVLSAHLYRLYLAVPYCLDQQAATADAWTATVAATTSVMPDLPPYHKTEAELEIDGCSCGPDLQYLHMTCATVRRWLPSALTASSAVVLAGVLLSAWQMAHTVTVQRRTLVTANESLNRAS